MPDTHASGDKRFKLLDAAMKKHRLVSISALSFEHGKELTESAKSNMQAALVWIRGWLAEALCTKSA